MLACIICLIFLVEVANGQTFPVFVNTSNPIRSVSTRFLSIGWDMYESVPADFYGFDFSYVEPLATALGDCYFRFGGTSADQTLFTTNNSAINPNSSLITNYYNRYVITAAQIDQLYSFSQNVGWRFLFDLNILTRNGNNWDPTNTISFLNYVSSKGYDMDFQLGNEPENYDTIQTLINNNWINGTLTGVQIAQAYAACKSLLNTYNNGTYNNSLLVGPVVGAYHASFVVDPALIPEFFNHSGGNSINAFDFHHYYWDNTATLDDVFQNTSLFDAWYEVVYEAKKLTNWFQTIWCGECSTMTGGGAKGISDRFASGFLWLDKLGIAATYGLDVVIRHALWGDSGFYALLNTTNFQPKPDYWLSFLYKKLVGTDVLRVTVNSASGPITTPQNQSLRLYAASTASDNGFVLYGLNMYSCLENGLIIDLPDVNNKQITAYVLTGYNDDNLGLASRYASLNNALLNWTSHQPTPNIQGQVASLPFTVPPYSLFFLVVNQTQVTQCPAGWYQVPNTNKCINVFQANQPWFGANFNCSLYGQNASLLSIQNDTEAYYVHQLTLGTSCSQSFIGLLSNNNGSNWTWSNGDSSTYQLWQTGYPVNDNTKNCVAFDKNAGKFYNVDCDQPRCYICQLYI